jgi:hypothetical protein
MTLEAAEGQKTPNGQADEIEAQREYVELRLVA